MSDMSTADLITAAAHALGVPLLAYHACVALARGELEAWARTVGGYARRGEYALPRATRVFCLFARALVARRAEPRVHETALQAAE